MDKTVLVIDDTPANLKFAVDVLSDSFKVASAKSGEKALNFILKNPPDIILLDINMPDMDGFQTMAEIKKHIDTRTVPVIFLSGENGKQAECIACGGADCVLKPFDAQFMIHKIKTYLELAEYRKKPTERK